MTTYRLYELDDLEFEQLVIHICMGVLGTGTVAFAVGKDGGRDARFVGTAERFPSAASPLTGKFIIQAKHTTNQSASCSDSQFTQIIKKEKPRITKLAANGELEHYLLFTNRKLPAIKDAKLREELGRIEKIKTVHISGTETIQQQLTMYPEIWRDLDFDTNGAPFRINPTDLVNVIRAFQEAVSRTLSRSIGAADFSFVDKSKKNRLNNLSRDYYEYIQSDSLPHFGKIKEFLEDPRNEGLRATYHDAADDLKAKIITFRGEFDTFDEVLTHLYDEIVSGTKQPGQKRLVRIFLHYMYFDCDIGRHA